MEPLAREDILAAFFPKQRKSVELPDLDNIDWDGLDYLGWQHRSGHLAYVVYQKNGYVQGIVLKQTKSTKETQQCLCSWCMTVHRGGGVTLFTAATHQPHRVQGVYVCADLQCSAYIRGKKRPAGCQMRETISQAKRMARLRYNIERFFGLIHGRDVFAGANTEPASHDKLSTAEVNHG